jgi:PKD repeat protein
MTDQNRSVVSTISTSANPQEDRMATRTKTTVSEPEFVDLDGDGDADAVVTRRKTVTKTVVEEEDIVLLPEEQETPDPSGGGTPRAAGDPGECGSNPCLQRTALTFTEGGTGLTLIATPSWKGNIAWDFGDGSAVVVGRGPVEHEYDVAGPYTVKATPLHSACLKAGSATVTVA